MRNIKFFDTSGPILEAVKHEKNGEHEFHFKKEKFAKDDNYQKSEH